MQTNERAKGFGLFDQDADRLLFMQENSLKFLDLCKKLTAWTHWVNQKMDLLTTISHMQVPFPPGCTDFGAFSFDIKPIRLRLTGLRYAWRLR